MLNLPNPRNSFYKGIFYPILLWILFTPFSSKLDMHLSQFFYEQNSFSSNPIWQIFYIYGIWPAWISILIACLGLGLSIFKKFRRFFRPCLFLVLTLAIGSGLLVHLGLKEHWGRPRPKQIEEFGGEQKFRPYYSPNFQMDYGPSKSFSCGHCSVGFYFFSLMLLGIYLRSNKVFWIGLGLSLFLGMGLSFARIAEGGHFLSDTLASALIMWLTAWILAYFLLFKDVNNYERTHS